MSQSASPLLSAKQQCSNVSQRVEEFRQLCAKSFQVEPSSEKSKQISQLHQQCVHLRAAVDDLLDVFYKLSPENEPRRMADFSQQKKLEIRRIQGLQARLSNLASQLEPDEVEEAYFRSMGVGEQADAETAEETTTESEAVLPEEDTAPEEAAEPSFEDDSNAELPQAEAISDYTAQQAGDLTVQEGEVVYIVDMSRSDGWWLAQNDRGEEGLVPSNHFQLLESEVETEASSLQELGEQVLQESTFSRTSQDRWKAIRNAVLKPSLSDILRSIGAVPSGFRDSTLAKLQKQDQYQSKHFLCPRLDKSGISFLDLHWDAETNSLQSRNVAVTRAVSVVICRRIPLPGDGVTVLDHHVRIAFFDNSEVLSNVCSVRATLNEKEQRTWRFPGSSSQAGGIFDNNFVTRINSNDHKLSLLFEVGITYKRKTKEEVGEMSCGWAVLPLFDNHGLVGNRTFELKLSGGTPHESGVEVDQTAQLGNTRAGRLKASLLQGGLHPTITVRLFPLSAEQVNTANLLPETFICRLGYVQQIAWFRQIQADVLLRDRPDSRAADAVSSPVLAVFPPAVDDYQIMDAVEATLSEDIKAYKKVNRSANRRPANYKKGIFEKVLLKTVYLLLSSTELPKHVPGDLQLEKERADFIEEFISKDPVNTLFSSHIRHRPFHTDEVAFDLLDS